MVMFELESDIADSIPDEVTRVSSFQLLQVNQLTLKTRKLKKL